MSYLKYYSILIISLLGGHFAHAQNNNQKVFHNTFQNYSTQNGLSQNDIRALFQDSWGYIWIGTHDGLNRFDGYSFKTFRKETKNPNSIGSSLISCIAEDSFGNLWIGTDDEGVSMYERSSGKFINFQNTPSQPNLLANNNITSITVDSKNNVWVGTYNGLSKLYRNHEDGQLSHITFRADNNNYGSINNNHISALHQDKFGNIWIGTQKGLTRYISNSDNQSGQFVHYDTGPTHNVTSISETDKSLILVSRNVFTLPFHEINKTNPGFNQISVDLSLRKILVSSDEYIWSSSDSGVRVLSLIDDKANVEVSFTHHWANNNSLSGNITSEIIQDKSGIIWIGTNGGGVSLYKPNRGNFRHYRKNENGGSLSYNKIRSIFEDHEKNLWIGTEGGGLNFLSNSDARNYESGFQFVDALNSDYMAPQIYSIDEYVASDKKLMIIGSDYSQKLTVASKRELLDVVTSSASWEPSHPTFAMHITRDSTLWIGTYGGGLYRYKIGASATLIDKTKIIPIKGDSTSISSEIIRSINQDNEGNVWIGTSEGLNKLIPSEQHKSNPKFIRYIHNPNEANSLSHDYILPIFVSEAGQVWVGTLGGGLNRLIKGDKVNNDTFQSYSTEQGLPNNVIKGILEDDENNLWISSNAGLTRFSPESNQIKTFGINDGLQDLEFSELAAFKRGDGELLFGGVNGFNAFYPQDIKYDTSEVQVVFGELQILNQTIEPLDTLNGRVLLDKEINLMDGISINNSENSFSIGFSALHYAAPEQNKYMYKLEGFDSEWIYTSSQDRIAKYTNLPSGNYTFMVRASNNDGYWSEKVSKLNVIINPSRWLSVWAIMAYSALFLCGLWFFRKFTIITVQKKNEFLLEHFEKEKIEELSQVKLKFFTNISHEFRTPLTLIIGFVERLRTHSSSLTEEDRHKYYERIDRNSQVLLKLINQLLGFRKLEQGKMKLRVSYNDLGNYVNLLGEHFYEMANKKQIDFNVKYEDSVHTWFDAEVIERVIFNLLSNAFKFTPNNGKITVSLSEDNEYVYIQVKDTGPGIPPEIQANLFERFSNSKISGENGTGIGLSFIKSLVEMHHGDIMFQTSEKGTTFKVILPTDKEVFSEEETVIEDSFITSPAPKPAGAITESNEQEGSSKKEKTLLIVEDNEDILFFLKENFKNDYNIHLAHEGAEALRKCLDNTIDLVVSDVMMDGMDGFEFCEKLKSDERINHIPIILLTAKDGAENKIKGYSTGAEAYISKPFNVSELESRIDSILESRENIMRKFTTTMDLSPSEIQVTSLDEKFLKRAISIIEENIGNSEFTVRIMARECGMSQLHLNKKLKTLVGHTSNTFIRSIRLKRAAQLLEMNRYSINEVMYEVGFIDAKYFRICFKKMFEMTPSEYQKTKANEAEG